MAGKPVVQLRRAERDAREIVARYLAEAGEGRAVDFAQALDRAMDRISRHPAAGSPRYARELGLPGLRFVTLGRYPHLVFYIERENRVDVLRVLHGGRDIPASMREP